MERSEYFDPIINPQEIKSEEQEMVKQKMPVLTLETNFPHFLKILRPDHPSFKIMCMVIRL